MVYRNETNLKYRLPIHSPWRQGVKREMKLLWSLRHWEAFCLGFLYRTTYDAQIQIGVPPLILHRLSTPHRWVERAVGKCHYSPPCVRMQEVWGDDLQHSVITLPTC
ncbi:hypothetical protein FKM82_022231 [Ascaphus truei]